MEKQSSRRRPESQIKKVEVDDALVGTGPSLEERLDGLTNELSTLAGMAEIMLTKAGGARNYEKGEPASMSKAPVGLQDKARDLEGIVYGLKKAMCELDAALFNQGAGRT